MGVAYDLDLVQSYDGIAASVINNCSYNTNKRFPDSELDGSVFGIQLNQGVGMERTDSALGFSITRGSSISSPSDKVVLYNINAFPFPDQSHQASDVNSTVFYVNNLPSPISDFCPLPRASMFTVPKQLSARPNVQESSPKAESHYPELFIRMGLADNPEVVRKTEQWVLNLWRQGLKLRE